VHLEVNKVWSAGPIIVNQMSAQSNTAALTLVDQLSLSINREELRDLCIVASCDSYISQQTADVWSDESRLFSAKLQNGLVPSEGAAGVLFASKKSAAGFELDTPVEMRRLASARRDKSIDASGKISTALLEQLAEQALLVGGVEPAKVSALISDIDQRANRLQEITAVARKLEAIESSTDSIALNAACGHVGIASSLVCLALSHQLAQDKNNAVLLLCASDAHDRAALALLPVSEESQALAAPAAS
jgi:3-oxoacyl-(acyl-carrier-protein) synthase